MLLSSCQTTIYRVALRLLCLFFYSAHCRSPAPASTLPQLFLPSCALRLWNHEFSFQPKRFSGRPCYGIAKASVMFSFVCAVFFSAFRDLFHRWMFIQFRQRQTSLVRLGQYFWIDIRKWWDRFGEIYKQLHWQRVSGHSFHFSIITRAQILGKTGLSLNHKWCQSNRRTIWQNQLLLYAKFISYARRRFADCENSFAAFYFILVWI